MIRRVSFLLRIFAAPNNLLENFEQARVLSGPRLRPTPPPPLERATEARPLQSARQIATAAATALGMRRKAVTR